MFNKKLKQELSDAKKQFNIVKYERDTLAKEMAEKDREIKRLEDFNKKIDSKLEELCKPKIDNFCLTMAGSGLMVSSSSFNVLDKKYESLEALLVSQAKDLERLKEREEDTKKILFLSGKVEELLRKLNKK